METKEKSALRAQGWKERLKPLREMLPRLGGRYAAALMLSRGLILGGCAPLAPGFVGASGSGAEGFAALCGALTGYLLGMDFAQALRYSAAVILIYAVAFALYDTALYKTAWFMSLCSAAVCALTGFAYLSGAGWDKEQLIAYLTEISLAGVSCTLFREEKEGTFAREGWLLLTAGGAAALSGFDVLSGGIFAAAITLLAARGGSGCGAVTGAVMGLAVGLTAGGTPLLGGVLALSGALTGSSVRTGRLCTAGIFLVSGLMGALWVQGGTVMALQVLSGSILALCMPESIVRVGDELFTPGVMPRRTVIHTGNSAAVRRMRARLEQQAAAFRTIHERIRGQLQQSLAPEPPAVVFERAAARVCTNCHMQSVCWQQRAAQTRESLGNALGEMLHRGRVLPEDFGVNFYATCPNVERFVKVSNEELREYWSRLRYASRIRTSRLAVCRQYLQLSHLLELAAAELEDVQQENTAAAAAVERGLRRLGFQVQAQVRLDHRRRHRLELRGRNLAGLRGEEGCAALGQILGARMEPGTLSRVRQGQCLAFREAPPLMATVAAAAAQKEGQSVSGDTGTWFRDENGILWVVLCDGMGSGEAAALDSGLLMNLLEEFLHAGVDPAAALSTVTEALALRGEVNGGFTTVDLLSIDLFSGSTQLYKLGGAPTYLRRKGLVSRVMGSALPAGLELDRETVPDCSRFRLEAGDFAVLISDGVSDGESDGALRQALAAFHGESPRELARTLLGFGGGGDDRTVIAVRLSQRG